MTRRGRRDADEALAMHLAAGATVRDAVRSCGLSEKTAHRRLLDPLFRRRVTDYRSQMIGRALGLLADTSADAATCLRDLLTAQAETVRLAAARAILELSVRLREATELEERIAALEARQEGGQPA